MSKRIVDNQPSKVSELYNSLQRRFSKAPHPPEPVVYEFTDDRAMLHQYYRIREIMYRKVHDTDKFSGREDLHDKIGHILIARRGRMVVGGCRLIIREGDEEFMLPMEHDSLKIRSAFPHLHLTRLRHGEISRFAVLDSDSDHLEIMLALSQLIMDKCVNDGLGYVFIKAPGMVMARNWRKIIATQCGQKNVRICGEIKMPDDADYPEIQWKMIRAVLPAATALAEVARPVTDLSYAVPAESLVH